MTQPHYYLMMLSYLTGFRNQMLRAVRGFSNLKKNGLFINSCFAHCQTERQDTWFADDSPVIHKKVTTSSSQQFMCLHLPTIEA